MNFNFEEIPNAVVEDIRSVEEQLKDWKHLAGSTPINWQSKNTWKTYTQRFQSGSFSCVFQSCAKALEILTGKIISATPYFWRKNYPEQGSFLQDGGDVFYNRFSTLETLSPSQNQSEAQMNKIKQLTTTLGITGYRQPNFKSIDEIAEAIEAYGQCLITVETNSIEYSETPAYYGGEITFRHCICAVDYGLVNGKKVIRCEDSAGQNSSPLGIRYLTEDFIKNRATGSLYFLGAKDVTVLQDATQQKISILQRLIILYKQAIELLTKK